MDSLNGEEKKDASKEDLEQEEGRSDNFEIYITLRKFFKNLERKRSANGNRERNFYHGTFLEN